MYNTVFYSCFVVNNKLEKITAIEYKINIRQGNQKLQAFEILFCPFLAVTIQYLSLSNRDY